MNRRQKYKQTRMKVLINQEFMQDLSSVEKQAYRKIVKQINETNKRLEQLEKIIDINRGRYNPKTKRFERTGEYVAYINKQGKLIKKPVRKEFKIKKGTWATKKLKKRLGDLYNVTTNRVKIPKGRLKPIQFRNISKALKYFEQSKTSTLKGIKDVRNKTLETIANITENIKGITEEDIETLYDFFEDDDFNDMLKYVGASEMFVELSLAKVYSKGDPSYFLNRMSQYIDKESLYADDDMKDALLLIYKKMMLG